MTSLPTAITSVGDVISIERENMRGRLALMVVGLVVILALIIVWVVYKHGGGDDAKLLVTGVFTPIIGIAGTVLGFYFGSQQGE